VGEAHLYFMCCQLGWIDYSLRIQLKVADKLMLAVNWEPQVLSMWACSLIAWAFSKSKYSKMHKGDDNLWRIRPGNWYKSLLLKSIGQSHLRAKIDSKRGNPQWCTSKLSLKTTTKSPKQNNWFIVFTKFSSVIRVINIMSLNTELERDEENLSLRAVKKQVPAHHSIRLTSQSQTMCGHT